MNMLVKDDIAPDKVDAEQGVVGDRLAEDETPPSLHITQHHHNDVLRSRISDSSKPKQITPRRRRTVMLMTADLASLCLSVYLGYALANLTRLIVIGDSAPIERGSWVLVSTMFLVPLVLVYWCCWSWNHYSRFRPTWTELRETTRVCVYVGVADVVALFAFNNTFSRLWIGFFIISLLVCMPLFRQASRSLMIRFGWWLKSTYVVGTGENALMTAAALESDIAMGHRVDGFIDLNDCPNQSSMLGNKPVFKQFPILPLNADTYESPCIVFAFESLSEMNKHRAIVNQYFSISPEATVSPPISGLPLYGSEVVSVFKQDTVLLKLKNAIGNPRARLLKRSFDVLISSLLLSILSPIIAGLYWLVGRDGNPPIFGHNRIGKSGETFSCLKFRSMVVDADKILARHLDTCPEARDEWMSKRKLTNDPRITPIGQWLRKTSLDELPQLWNVLRGDMSLVGPRPIVEEEAFQYGDQYPAYLSMTPGITGLWQTSGRSDTTFRERVLLDVWYSRNWSLWHDVVILIRTVPALLRQAGAR